MKTQIRVFEKLPFHENAHSSKTGALLSRRFPSGEFFCLFLRFEKDEFQDRVGSNCCRRHVKGKEATSNTKIVANKPTAAAAAAAAATSTFTATVITANIIDQTFTRFFSVGESRHYWYKNSRIFQALNSG